MIARRAGVFALFVVSGCGVGECGQGGSVVAPETVVEAPRAVLPPPVRPSALPSYASMRVADAELPVGVTTTTGREPSAIVMDAGTTITVAPATTFLRSAVSPVGLALGVGTVSVVTKLPEGAAPKPVRIATLGGTLELPAAATAFVATSEAGAVYVSLMEGEGRFLSSEGEAIALSAQDGLSWRAGAPAVSKGLSSAEAVREAAGALRGPVALPDTLELASELRARVAGLDEERERARTLRGLRGEAARQPAGTAALDGEHAAQVAALEASEASVLATYERAEALAARLGAADAGEASRYLSTLAPIASRALPLLRR